MSSVSALKSKFNGVEGGTYHNTAVETRAESLSEQFFKGKVSRSPTYSSNDASSPRLSAGKNSMVLSPKKNNDGSTEGSGVEGTSNTETTSFVMSKSRPPLGSLLGDGNGSHEEKRAPDPSGAVSPRSKKSGSSPRKTVRKTAIKASELGIDLTDVSSETLNAAVNKWRAEQTGKSKPDPVGVVGGAKRRQSTGRISDPLRNPGGVDDGERPKSRAKSRGRETSGDMASARARSKSRSAGNRSRSKSRSRSQKSDLSGDGRDEGVKTPNGVVKRKIIVRRRASLDTPNIGGTPAGSTDVKFPNLQVESTTKGSDTAEMCVEAVLEQVPLSPKRTPRKTEVTDSAEMCVEAVLDQVPLSPRHFQRRTEVTGSVSTDVQQPSVSRGRVMVGDHNDVHEIQKRLKVAGITDEQYRAMTAAGLSISLS